MIPNILRILLIAILAVRVSALAEVEGTNCSSQEAQGKIDNAVRKVLMAMQAPSASVAIIQDGKVAYVQAYGDARLNPQVKAKPEMRYCIGSISKQFTAAAILMLAEEGKLSLDDPVGRFLPDLTRAREVTIRQVLSHTSGYQDYWPQDYVPPFMRQPITADQILDRWARRPLDFEPGTDYQYSNTGYVIAGLIVERASGRPLLAFLRDRIFIPLGMRSVVDVDQDRLTDADALGYLRYGLGPPRLAPKEGEGWLFAAGELAMTAEDLAKWDLSVLQQTLLKPESYRVMESAVVLKNGIASNYGLGVNVNRTVSRRTIAHGGEVSGFMAHNAIYPDEKAAVVVLCNCEAEAPLQIEREIARVLFSDRDSEAQQQLAHRIFEGLQHGQIDRSLFSENGNACFSEEALNDFKRGLQKLGKPQSLIQTVRRQRGGMTVRIFEVNFRRQKLSIWQLTLPDGKLEQFKVLPSS